MNLRLLSALIVILLAFSFCAACTDSDDTGGISPPETPTATVTAAPTTPISLTPGPTQTLSPGKEVEFQIEVGYPSRFTHDLTVTFNGGKGQSFVKTIDLHVTKSNGEVVTETLKPIIGDEVTISNAQGENRVEIIVSLVSGESCKVKDEIVVVS